MNKGKWILLGFLMLAVVLLRILLEKWNVPITMEVSMWLLFAIAGFIFIGVALTNKEYKKWAKLLPILCLLLAISSMRGKSPDSDKKDGLKTPKNQGQTQTVIVQKTGWEESVEVTGRETEGKIVFVQESGWYEINYLGGKIYDTPEDKIRGAAYDIWGAEYDREWKPYFVYSHIPGVKALETLMIIDGEIGSQDGKVCQFPDGKTTVRIWVDKYIRFFRHEPIVEDINGNIYWCFQNNWGSWRFEIKKVM